VAKLLCTVLADGQEFSGGTPGSGPGSLGSNPHFVAVSPGSWRGRTILQECRCIRRDLRPMVMRCGTERRRGRPNPRIQVPQPLCRGLPGFVAWSHHSSGMQPYLRNAAVFGGICDEWLFALVHRLHSRYGLLDCSTAQGGLCHEASTQPVTQLSRSSATRSYRQLPGWILPPLVNRAVGAH